MRRADLVNVCSKHARKLVHKRISSSGDELQNQIDSGWVNVSDMLHVVHLYLAKLEVLFPAGQSVFDGSH